MDRRLSVVMMADLAGYSALMEDNPSAAIAQVREMRTASLEPLVERAGGRIEKRMGDGWLITFASATQAIEAAQAIQAGLSSTRGLKLRLAVHIAEIVEEDGELYGSGINIAARLQAQGPPGGLIISADCYQHLDPAQAAAFADAGSLDLKNVKAPVACFHWRPVTQRSARADYLPVIAVAPIAAAPQRDDVPEASGDLTEQLVHRLSRRTGIRVLPMASAEDPLADATYVLRGRIRAAGSGARAMLSLVRCDTSHVVWSETYEHDGEDLYALCDHVAGFAENALRVQINAFDGQRLEGVPEDELTRSELRSRAAQLFHAQGISDYNHAEQLLMRALTLDPDNAMTHGMFVHAVLWPHLTTFVPVPEHVAARSIKAANKAVRGAPRSDFVFFTRAQVRAYVERDLAGAHQDVARALQLTDGYVWALETRGIIHIKEGKFDAAAEDLRETIRRSAGDPWLPRRLAMCALAEYLSQDDDRAAEHVLEATELAPEVGAYWRLMARICDRRGDHNGAERARMHAVPCAIAPTIMWNDLGPPDHVSDLCREMSGL